MAAMIMLILSTKRNKIHKQFFTYNFINFKRYTPIYAFLKNMFRSSYMHLHFRGIFYDTGEFFKGEYNFMWEFYLLKLPGCLPFVLTLNICFFFME